MTTYITTQEVNGHQVIKTVHPTKAAADAAVIAAAAEADPEVIVAIADPVDDDVEPGWYYIPEAGGVAASISSAHPHVDLHARRDALRRILIQRERDYSVLWGGRTPYTRHIEMLCRAASQDANLTDDARHAAILAEAIIAGDTWQITRDNATWTAALEDDRTKWKFYRTDDDGEPSEVAGVTLDLTTDFVWVIWLRETD